MDASTHNMINSNSNTKKKTGPDTSQVTAEKKQPPILQVPGDWFPHTNKDFDALWVKMDSRELAGMHTGGGPAGQLKIGKKGPTFKFLAPLDIIESHAHEWEPYASIQSKVLEKVVSFSTGIEHGVQVITNLLTSFKDAGQISSGKALANVIANMAGVSVPKYKVDAPLIYRNSQRRRMDFTFTLADASYGEHLVDTVHTLMELAAPVSKNKYEIEFPYVFTISTEPEGLFRMDYAAITQIAPTWKHPFVYGYPIVCELTVSVMDMSPLFRKTIEQGGIINIVNKPVQKSYDTKEMDKRFQKENFISGTGNLK